MSTAAAIVKHLLENDDDDFDPKEYASNIGDEINAKNDADWAAGNITAHTIRRANLGPGSYIYSRRKIGAQAKVTSVKLWPTRPNDFQIKWKYGMYEYGDVTPRDADQFSLKPGPSQEEVDAQRAAKREGKRQSVYNRDEPVLGESHSLFGR